MKYTYRTTVKLHHTDAAGFLFYSHLFTLAFDAYDAFLNHIGVRIADIIQSSPFLLPYVHAEADFLQPMYVGEKVSIVIEVDYLGKQSFILNYHFKVEGQLAATASTAHVSIDRQTKKAIELPERLRTGLSGKRMSKET